MWNAGMRGCKCTAWHGGTRAISFWRWPEHFKPAAVQQLTGHVDVLPTFCELAGVELPADLDKKLDGYSLLPLLEAEGVERFPKDRLFFQHVGRWPSGTAASHREAMAGVRQGGYLLVRSQPCEDPACTKEAGGQQCDTIRNVKTGGISDVYTETNAQTHWGFTKGPGGWSLYDVRKDPACLNDLALKMPERADLLKKSYYAWWDELFPTMIEMGGDAAAQ
jgi:arylsulfatase A-like enzyme